MEEMIFGEHDKKNNLNVLLTEPDGKDGSENMLINHAVHPLKQSNNPRAIDDEEWENMRRLLQKRYGCLKEIDIQSYGIFYKDNSFPCKTSCGIGNAMCLFPLKIV